MKTIPSPLSVARQRILEAKAIAVCFLYCLFNDWYFPHRAKSSRGKLILVAAIDLRSTRGRQNRIFYTALP